MKKFFFFILLTVFILYTFAVILIPDITAFDIRIIYFVQDILKNLPLWIPSLCDCILYFTMIFLPLIIGNIFFFRRYLLIDNVLFSLTPVITYYVCSVLKYFVHRLRPPAELQQLVHPHSFSYVSRHTLVTSVLYFVVIYYLLLYCKNKFLKITLIALSLMWILLEGLSRVWLGVHYPTDVLGAYLLSIIVLMIYISLERKIGGKN